MKKFIKLICTIFLVQLTVICFSQKVPMRFDKIDMSDMLMTKYEKDTSASAVILCDYGRSYFEYTEKEGFLVVLEHHRRIKILDQTAYNWANISIPFYHRGSSQEKVYAVKGNTYNLVKGKIKKSKLSKKERFIEETSKNWSAVKFTMPNVKEGSIIEYKYTIKSEFVFNFRDWQFQYDIPVVWSEYLASIPEYFDYSRKMKGYYPLIVNDHDKFKREYTYTYDSKIANAGVKNKAWDDNQRQSSGNGSFEVFTDEYRWVAKDLPALREEPYMTNIEDYCTALEFELVSVQFPQRPRKDYTNTWNSINKQLLEDGRFGHQISDALLAAGSSFIKDRVKEISSNPDYQTPEIKMLAAFEFVKNYMKWNGLSRKYTTTTLRKAFKDKAGSSADINLLLTLILKELKLDADPVVLSTRKNGTIHPAHPSLSQLNYVIACVTLDGKQILLDATDPLHAVGLLPYRCLNGQGRIVSLTKSDWVELNKNKVYALTVMSEFTMDEEGLLIGKNRSSRDQNAALVLRNRILSENSKDDFIKKLETDNNGLEVIEYKFDNLENVYKPLRDQFEVKIHDKVDVMGNMIYFNPLLYDQIEDNPFKIEKRLFPVDYGYKTKESYMYKYTIPEGYVVEEVPKSIAIALPQNAARYTYVITVSGNQIQVMSKFSINKIIFGSEEYLVLKNFYDQVIAKQAEQIVLKKSTP